MDEPHLGPTRTLVGEVVAGRYRVERLLGEGAMGAVYLVEHTHMRKRRALKVLHPDLSADPDIVERFEREAIAGANIEHPNVATATDFGRMDDGAMFLVMEYLEGESLRAVIDRGRMTVARALHVGRQVADALGRAHALGIVHRDVKPENVMLVRRDGDEDFVKVLDFGVAKVPVDHVGTRRESASRNLTRAGLLFGTPEYMAPEQAIGDPVDGRADLYALGVMLFEMLTGLRPFGGESLTEVVSKHLTAEPPPMSTLAPEARIPSAVEDCVRRLLEKRREQRFASASEVIQAIELAAEAHRIELPPRRASAAIGPGGRLSIVESPPSVVVVPAAARPVARATSLVRSLRDAPWLVASVARGRTVVSRLPFSARIGVAVAALLGCTLLAAVLSRRASGEASPALPREIASASARASAAPATQLPSDAEVLAATRGGVVALERRAPGDRRVLRALVSAYAKEARHTDAVRAVRALVAIDPDAAEEKAVLDVVVVAADDPAAAEPAFLALEEGLGAAGVDALLEIAARPRAGAARSRAQRGFGKPAVRDRASPAALVVLDLRAATACDARRAVLPLAQEHGDARVLPLLKPLQSTSGCGFLGLEDCHRCLRRDRALSEAIAAIESRRR